MHIQETLMTWPVSFDFLEVVNPDNLHFDANDYLVFLHNMKLFSWNLNTSSIPHYSMFWKAKTVYQNILYCGTEGVYVNEV
jgi:hypothetical protein